MVAGALDRPRRLLTSRFPEVGSILQATFTQGWVPREHQRSSAQLEPAWQLNGIHAFPTQRFAVLLPADGAILPTLPPPPRTAGGVRCCSRGRLADGGWKPARRHAHTRQASKTDCGLGAAKKKPWQQTCLQIPARRALETTGREQASAAAQGDGCQREARVRSPEVPEKGVSWAYGCPETPTLETGCSEFQYSKARGGPRIRRSPGFNYPRTCG